MTEQEEIQLVLEAIKKYLDFYGYNLERTIVGADVGLSEFATTQEYQAWNGTLSVKVDKDKDTWFIHILLRDAIDNIHFEKKIEKEAPLPQIKDELHSALKKLEPNKSKAVNTEESFLLSFYKSSRYLIEKEYEELFQ